MGTREKMETGAVPVVVMFAQMAEARLAMQAALVQIEKLLAKKKET